MAKNDNIEFGNFHRNIMGTLSFDMKLPNMRKAQDFIVYPASEKTDFIMIQSSTRFGKINMTTGMGLMSQSHANGAYAVHMHIDKLVKFQLTDSQLEKLKEELAKTAGSSVGRSVVISDNSYADKFDEGGSIAGSMHNKGTFKITPTRKHIISDKYHLFMYEIDNSISFTKKGTEQEAIQEAKNYVECNSPEIISAIVTKLKPSGEQDKNDHVSYVFKDDKFTYSRPLDYHNYDDYLISVIVKEYNYDEKDAIDIMDKYREYIDNQVEKGGNVEIDGLADDIVTMHVHNIELYPKSSYAKGGYVEEGEDYEYVNTFGIDQDDFEKLVDAYHKSPSYDQAERVESRLIFRKMREKYGESKIDEIGNYIHETHESHEHYAKGGETKFYGLGGDITKYKKTLISKAQKNGIYENFGEIEVNKLKDKYNYNQLVYGTPEQRQMARQIDMFDEWAMSYDGSNTFAKGGMFGAGRFASGGELVDKTIDHDGRYLHLVGNHRMLHIHLNNEGREMIMDERESGRGDEEIMYDLFEDIVGNSTLMYHTDLGESGFGMTSSSGVTYDYGYDDNGDLVPLDDNAVVYVDNDSYRRSPVEELLEGRLIMRNSDFMARGGKLAGAGQFAKGGRSGKKHTMNGIVGTMENDDYSESVTIYGYDSHWDGHKPTAQEMKKTKQLLNEDTKILDDLGVKYKVDYEEGTNLPTITIKSISGKPATIESLQKVVSIKEEYAKGGVLKIGKDDFSFLLELSDKELSKRLDLIRKQQGINGEQYLKAREKGESTKAIEEAGERLAKQERAIIEARMRK